jgi:predicted nucleic acid-binding protein
LSRFHLDTDFLIHALSSRGVEWQKLREVVDSPAVLEISAVAWYEYCRGPRTPEQLAAARALFGEDGVIPLSEAIAETSGAEFRRLGSPRKHAADILIGVTASIREATLLTRNAADFAGITGLEVEVLGVP